MPELLRTNSPDWGWYIVLYFFVGGIAAGAYLTGALLELFGERADRTAMRIAHWLAFPLLVISGLLLIVDLRRPERFFHMLFQSDQMPLLAFKWWSPMSVGSWVLLLFSAVAFVSFVDALLEARTGRSYIHRGLLGTVWSVVGSALGLFFASYTGVLLATTNFPVWSTSPWISVLFLASAMSTGLATILLLLTLGRRYPVGTRHKLEEADRYTMGLELLLVVAFVATLGALALPFAASTPALLLLWGGVVVVGLLVPLLLNLRPTMLGSASTVAGGVLALVGGFILRYVVVMLPQELFH